MFMNPIDAGIAAIVVVSAGFGVWKGFFRQIFGIIVMVVSTVAAVLYFRSGGSILASGGVFLVTGGVLHIAFALWQKSIKKDAALSWVSRAGGGIVGGIIGFIYAAIILMSLQYFVVLFPAGSGFAQAIAESRAYGIYNAVSGAPKRPAMITQGIVIDEQKMESLRKNPAIKAMLDDKEFTSLVEKRDFAGIMAHPVFHRIMEDPQLLKELTDAALQGNVDGQKSRERGKYVE